MSKLIFKHEIYKSGFDCLYTSTECAQQSQLIFDEWLEKQTVVYARQDRYGWTTEKSPLDTHKAYLVCIEEIKECEHEHVITEYPFGLNKTHEAKRNAKYRCQDCNKQLKPKNGWEVVNE